MSGLVERRIRQLLQVYDQARDVDVLLDLLQAENRAYVREMVARRHARCLDQELQREGDWVYAHAPPAYCQRRADYLKCLWEGVLGRPVEVAPVPGEDASGACRIALHMPVDRGAR